jgi:hypothetical protein
VGESLARDLVERARNVPYDVQRLAHELWDDAVRAEVRDIEPAMIAMVIRPYSAMPCSRAARTIPNSSRFSSNSSGV